MNGKSKKGSSLALRWRNALADSALGSNAKHVLKEIHSFMNADGRQAFPTIAMLARRTSLSEKTVRTHLKVAEDAGWIDVQEGRFPGKRWRRFTYSARFPDQASEVGEMGQEGAVNDG
ncbi:helix-turn-helix domain-containing protein [Shinella yambaruensis]|uniref:Helix-turn-helix domain-containing protein n=1 Tax=Shinella yambaruensis TaxID=415996 RepID=A0ABQ5ZR47_9HYPH|nr:helix-turn-helix domain-containing protein [Shinella yambaruensis]MCJ8030028.1 helix-turn-helix domain-containing protein [Shinella yambaruensis]MCU7984320.1 helix-turn-helix domain-containing protein [Shinella yambaruensis]GLR55148.1 hypothetical protein GCM10007923_63690 [Shinella yambaruensis]